MLNYKSEPTATGARLMKNSWSVSNAEARRRFREISGTILCVLSRSEHQRYREVNESQLAQPGQH